MLLISVLCIRWIVKGKFKFIFGVVSGDLVIKVKFEFIFN